MKIVVRPMGIKDLRAYCMMTEQADLGFYTMPKDPRVAKVRLDRSDSAFCKKVTTPERELYLFIAEDIETHTALGTSGIEATTGGKNPHFFYRRECIENGSLLKAVTKKIPILNPISYMHGPTEVCALFVHPEHRKTGVGKLLSFARFLFIATFYERFADTIFAQLRGVVYKEQTSPFWEGIGRKFFDMSFTELHALYQYDSTFIAQFLPTYPIYTLLLPQEVQDVIGKVDKATERALNLLIEIGFEVTDEIDVLDGAPKLSAKRDMVTIIKNSMQFQVVAIEKEIETNELYIVTNDRLDFRACYATLRCIDGMQVAISKETAEMLEVDMGNTIRAYKLGA